MSTRSLILRRTPGDSNPTGVYHHWDGYPSGVGATLWHLYHNEFKQDLDAMLKVLIDDHPAGWSSINNADWGQEPGFVDHNERICDECGKKSWEHYRQYYDDKTAKKLFKHLPEDVVLVLGHGSRTGYSKLERPQCYCHGARSEPPAPCSLDKAHTGWAEYVYILDPINLTLEIRTIQWQEGTKFLGEFDLNGPEPDWEKLDQR